MRSNKYKQSPYNNPIHNRRQTFQQNIRREYVDQLFKSIRDQLLTSTCEDYHILSKIDLDQCLKQIDEFSLSDLSKQLNKLDELALNLYSYGVSKRSDHLYSLIKDSTLEKIIRMVDWQLVDCYSSKPRLYVRILWILSNYCIHANSAPLLYFQTITKILTNLKNFGEQIYERKKDILYFSHVQLIFWSLTQIKLDREESLNFFVCKDSGFITAALHENEKILKLMKKSPIEQNDRETAILFNTIRLFQKFSSLTQYPKEMQQIILDLDFQIVKNLLQILSQAKGLVRGIQIQIAECFRSFFSAQLFQRPNILISHKFQPLFECFQQAAKDVVHINSQISHFHKKLDIEGQSKQTLSQLDIQLTDCEYRLSRWLGVLVLIFGVNIPEGENENEQAYYELLINWVQNFVFPTFSKIFKLAQLKSKEVMTKMMNILQNICLDQTLCEILLTQLPTINFIFYNCRSSQVRVGIRKSSLLCLLNIIKISMDTDLKPQVLSLMSKKEIISIIAQNVGQFSQAKINECLLQGLKIMLDVEPCEQRSQNQVWIRFCQEGGKYKLQKILNMNQDQWKDVVKFAEAILKQYESVEV